MRSIMDRLEEYLKRKRLKLNPDKTKIMRCRKGGDREKKREWRWKEKRIVEVKEFTYLGYVLQKNRGQAAQIRDRIRKVAAALEQVRRTEKRFGKD